MKKNIILTSAMLAMASVAAVAQDGKDDDSGKKQTLMIGIDREMTAEETTAAVSVISSSETDRRSAKNIGNSIIGQGQGIISLQNGGSYAQQNPTFYVRGLQTLNSNNAPLILVDGIERDITNISPEEVENVTILKDAAAVALYGYKGVNGAIQIVTKRGKYEAMNVTFTYDHVFNTLANKPKFANAATYAQAMNEARVNDGLSPRYSEAEVQAFRNGTYPYLYPNVDWVGETFRNTAPTNKFNVQFRGGARNFRYYAMLDFITDNGFIKNGNANDSYSTQDKYSKGNMRVNLDIDLTPTTEVCVNLLGVLAETSGPGAQADIWDMVYTVPSAAFPVRDENGRWAGSSTWDGTLNPVAQSQGTAYYRNHTRQLFADITIKQDLSSWLKGLGATVRAGYDNTANIYENHSKTYEYSVTVPQWTADGTEPTWQTSLQGKESEMGTEAKTNTYSRRFHFDAGLNYERTMGRHGIYTQLKWDYEYEDPEGINNTIYRQNVTSWTHYSYAGRYLADLALVYSGSSRLAPGTKWNFAPTLSLGWIVSKEKFMERARWIDFLKLRASAGIINADYLPDDNVWTYYAQQYQTNGTMYPFGSGWTSEFGTTSKGQVATLSPGHEKAYKYNVGGDARIFGSLTANLDFYRQHRTDIWVSAAGKYTSVIGVEAPYENAGVVDSWGVELGLDWNRRIGQVDINIGGNFNLNRNEIKEQLEEPRLYDNLVQTGHSVGQIYGLRAIGMFRDEADIAASPAQTFSVMRPGDIKYEDVNGDNVIDANDKVAIGYSDLAPEIYYNMHLGAEWRGLGIYMMWQGTGRYSAMLGTKSLYKPLVGNTTISEYYYENRWTEDNTEAKFPRLSSQSNANNYQNNTVFLADRSFLKLRDLEIYYNLPQSLLQKTHCLNAAKIYLRGNDLLCIDDFEVSDPEAYGTRLLNRSVALGVSLTF